MLRALLAPENHRIGALDRLRYLVITSAEWTRNDASTEFFEGIDERLPLVGSRVAWTIQDKDRLLRVHAT